ncbi:MAG: aminoacyl-tRNA hydrolase [Chitinivibrionales bacterium]|nr:aminoacyl-tRNA hydrolase [Chitinivibrionales bacterium]MBD3356628.1 aminoacyl-tRNA hydrolase [Chitinivibrionales bacterium]
MSLARLLGLFRSRRLDLKPPQYLIIGLGNKGKEYEATRHNVGFDLADRFAQSLKGAHERRMRFSTVLTGELESGLVVALAKPTTYMNRSGLAVRELLERYQMSAADCLVAVDDFNLDLGVLRFRKSGSDGGHNGLKSIIQTIGKGFPRLRMGIGPLPDGTTVVDFVLGRFEPAEMERKEEMIITAGEAVAYYIEAGIAATMNKYNAGSVREGAV